MSGDRVIYNGTEMAAEWPAQIEAAQSIHEYTIGGTAYRRIPYGQEEGGPFPEPCHDCAVLLGQYHVELVCDLEECPKCHGQVIGCDCPYDGDEAAVEPPTPAQAAAPIDWRRLLDRVGSELFGCALFLETADGRFVPLGTAGQVEHAVGIVATWARDGLAPWDTEAPAKQLAATLTSRFGVSALVLLSRRTESFVGHYVAIRP